jgi:16S rRNA (cytidine1402-2'-O)-methyltransferase
VERGGSVIQVNSQINSTLFLVATAIGDWDDITFRALRILKEADVIVYEEHREGKRLLAQYGISDKITELLNEHNEQEASTHILQQLCAGKNVALISDAGTPVLSDPGKYLVKMAIEHKIRITPIPGTSSIIPAVVISGFPMNEFLFYGFLSPKTEIRRKELHDLRFQERTTIFMETPYRLKPLLRDMAEVFENERMLCIAFNLTMPDEETFRGTVSELYRRFENTKIKGEFVVVLDGKK